MNDPGGLVAETIRRCSSVEDRLQSARVTATSPKAVVKVVYNGYGDAEHMTVKPNSVRKYACDTMADLAAAAFRAGDRAVEALRQHAYREVGASADDRGAAESAAATVAKCFGPGR